ncbi:SAM-dependent methyltransferase [Ereboglobus sp. PH5-10]|uniref:class I SAM-dependent methyltransferase n=1 Tax=Ereboglobus sp. PH5-10 TaxID=2940629 RepID=UPI002404EF59|nr:class I SAM-dependent methyltransferase [Ereboglobus sp. PH5-10]MDF9827763.1 SAM-dependent methyltransferase [Ereboglobus sp. PH5-10]
MKNTQDSVDELNQALNDAAAFNYVNNSLRITLREIGHSRMLIENLLELLEKLKPLHKIQKNLKALHIVNCFHRIFRKELDFIYRNRYEAHRHEFFSKNVFPFIKNKEPHVVDLGCGRGWVSKWIHDAKITQYVTGIDAVDFQADWKEVKASNGLGLDFKQVPVANQKLWFKEYLKKLSQKHAPVSMIICNWVFHHSTDQELRKTFEALRDSVKVGTKLLVIEDACDLKVKPKHNNSNLYESWCMLANENLKHYSRSQFHAQAILDFVAVRLLARYSAVEMCFNYKTTSDWIHLLKLYGFKFQRKNFIGFPKFRDIAVPQSIILFVKAL